MAGRRVFIDIFVCCLLVFRFIYCHSQVSDTPPVTQKSAQLPFHRSTISRSATQLKIRVTDKGPRIGTEKIPSSLPPGDRFSHNERWSNVRPSGRLYAFPVKLLALVPRDWNLVHES